MAYRTVRMTLSSAHRGKILLLVAVALLILERLTLAGYALARLDKPEINWTSVLLPLTHIAVTVFLLFTYDMLIYWLVIMWSVIVAGIFTYKFVDMFSWESLTLAHGLPGWWLVGLLMIFHTIIGIVLLMPSIRTYLAAQRSKLDFVDMPAENEKSSGNS
jgi:hypothetical protein